MLIIQSMQSTHQLLTLLQRSLCNYGTTMNGHNHSILSF